MIASNTEIAFKLSVNTHPVENLLIFNVAPAQAGVTPQVSKAV